MKTLIKISGYLGVAIIFFSIGRRSVTVDKQNRTPVYNCCNLSHVIHTYETDDINYHNGEILLPNNLHNDTLTVTNADSLNWAMEYYNAISYEDIKDILYTYCK